MAKEQQLPFGQITPVAKPLGSFIVPGQKQTAGAAKPSMIGSVPQIAALQQGSQGNVQGYNQFNQLAQALGPFTQNLIKAGSAVYENYAKTNMKTGMQNAPEFLEARNQLARAKLSLQEQQEKGAADAISAIDVLRKTDPDAAALLEVTNPWRLTGRRKYLSQMLASEVDNVFDDYLNNNSPELSKLPTDSPKIAEIQHKLMEGLDDKYGLTGDEPEYLRYVVSAENKAIDSFRDNHEKLYNEAVDISTFETATAAFKLDISNVLTEGITYTDPETLEAINIPVNHPNFSFLAGQQLTALLDDKLKLLSGKRRQDVLQKIFEEVVPTYSEDPIAQQALGLIRGGSQQDDYEKRPYLFQTMGYKLLEMRNEGLEAQNDAVELAEKSKEITLNKRWYGKGGPGRFRPDTKEYKDSIKEFYNGALAINYRNIEEYIADRNRDLETITSIFNKPTAKERSDYRRKLSTLTREDFENNYQQIFKELQNHALPMNDGGRYLNSLTQILDEREEYLAKRPDSIEDQLYRRLPEIMDDPKITPKGLKGGIFGSYNDQLNASLDQKGKKFSNKIITKILKSADKKADEWLRDNEARIVPENVGENLVDEAFDEYRASPEFKELYEKNYPTKEVKTEPKIDPKQIKKDSRDKPVGLVGSENVPDRVVKRYRERAVLNATWLNNELDNLNQQKEFSPQLKQFATRAKTSPERYLLEQIRFYRGPNNEYTFDPDGSVRKYLEGFVNNKKSTDQASLTYFNKAMASAVSPGPGDWMLNMMFGGPVNAEPMTTNTGLTQGDNNQRFQSAVALAKKLGAKYPEVIAAQFALESDFGRDPSGNNNLFGLKALPGTKGSLVNTEEDDASGKSKKVKANFINFDSEEKSFKYLIDKWYKDYKSFTGVESGKSIKEVTNLLQQQGYATDPNYAKTLQTLVQEYSIGG